jgi:hypothetical protein
LKSEWTGNYRKKDIRGMALFQSIKSRLVKIYDRNEGCKTDEEIEPAIKQIISEAITVIVSLRTGGTLI